eukprot:Ihof_evm2s604 gene=Ihof_evmTU2s604
MAGNDQLMQLLASHLGQTLSPDHTVRRTAEKELSQLESTANYSLLVLHLVASETVSVDIRAAAAITFKNFVKHNWSMQDGEAGRISLADRDLIKQNIIDLMLSVPSRLQQQLSEAVSIIGSSDFPDQWDKLLPILVEKLGANDFDVINGVLQTANSLFKRYTYEFKSDALFSEIKYVLDNFADPLTQLTKDDERPGPFEKTKAQICENVALYASKYDEEETNIKNHLPTFVQDIWSLLVTTGRELRNDYLVSGAIQFLASVAIRPRTSTIFAQEGVMKTICENVIIPNMQLRDEDVECFEDDPEEYMRRDIEGSDTETRRRAACDLVRALRTNFEPQVTEIFTAYVDAMLQEYAKNPAANWKSKDAAIFLITSLTVTSTVQTMGATKTNVLVDVNDFYIKFIVPDLQSPTIDVMPVLKADAIKYVLTFRNQLTREALLATLPILVHHIGAKSLVQLSYASNCLERVLSIKDVSSGNAREAKLKVGRADIKPYLELAFSELFGALGKSQSMENHYVMKAIMRLICVAQEDVVPYIGGIVQQLTAKLMEVAKNPSKPDFNHFLFESISASVRFVCQSDPNAVEAFEAALFPPFEVILQLDVTEFMPYVFQVMAQLLEVRQPPTPAQYLALFPHLLSPLLWEKNGNVPALTRLMKAFVLKGGEAIGPDATTMSNLLGVFQKLLSSKINDHHGFALIVGIVECVPKEYLAPYLKNIFILVFQRLQSGKTVKFVIGLLQFVALLMDKHGADDAINVIDSIQPQLFGMVINSLFIPDLQKVSGTNERKACAVGLTTCLTQSQAMMTTYIQQWPSLLAALIKLFELPREDRSDDDFIDVEVPGGYQNTFSRLAFSGKADHDPYKAIADPRTHLALALHQLTSTAGAAQ